VTSERRQLSEEDSFHFTAQVSSSQHISWLTDWLEFARRYLRTQPNPHHSPSCLTSHFRLPKQSKAKLHLFSTHLKADRSEIFSTHTPKKKKNSLSLSFTHHDVQQNHHSHHHSHNNISTTTKKQTIHHLQHRSIHALRRLRHKFRSTPRPFIIPTRKSQLCPAFRNRPPLKIRAQHADVCNSS